MENDRPNTVITKIVKRYIFEVACRRCGKMIYAAEDVSATKDFPVNVFSETGVLAIFVCATCGQSERIELPAQYAQKLAKP